METIWLCLINERIIKGVKTYDQAFEWFRAHECLDQKTGMKGRVYELKEITIEQPKLLG